MKPLGLDLPPVLAGLFASVMLWSAATLAQTTPLVGLPLLALCGPPLMLACLLTNLISFSRTRATPRGIASSMLAVLRVNFDHAQDAHRYSSSRPVRPRLRGSDMTTDDAPQRGRANETPGEPDTGTAQTREPQYNRCVDLKERHGLTREAANTCGKLRFIKKRFCKT